MVLGTKERIIADRQFATERYILSTLPVLYLPLYRLDSGSSGDNFVSADGKGHVCTVAGALWQPDGREFDGTDDTINVPAHASLDITETLTLITWVKHDIAGSEIFLGKRVDGSDDAYQLSTEAATEKITFIIWVSDVAVVLTGDTGLTLDTWECVAGVYNKVDLRVYKAGVLDSTPKAETGSIDVTTDDVTVGRAFNTSFSWDGTIGETWIYNRALSPQEVQDIYIATNWRYR